MDSAFFKAIGHIFGATENIAILVLMLLVAVLLWLLISERKRAEEAWKSHAELLKQNNEMLSQLLVTLALIKDRLR